MTWFLHLRALGPPRDTQCNSHASTVPASTTSALPRWCVRGHTDTDKWPGEGPGAGEQWHVWCSRRARTGDAQMPDQYRRDDERERRRHGWSDAQQGEARG